MKYFIFTVVFLIFNLSFVAQGDILSNPISISTECYASTPITSTNESLSGNTDSGESAVCGTGTDIFISFIAETQGIKGLFTSTDFDAVIELFDSSNNSISCFDVTTGTGVEEFWFTTLTIGNTYSLRVFAAGNAFTTGDFDYSLEHLPTVHIIGSPINGSDDAIDGHVGYRINNSVLIRRNQLNDLLCSDFTVESTRFIIDGGVYIQETNNNNFFTPILSFPDLCYGITYQVTVEVKVEGQWCGVSESLPMMMEAEPISDPSSIPNILPINNLQISSQNIGPQAITEWEFSSFPAATFVTNSNITANGTNYILVGELDLLLYNTYYSISTRTTYCGQIGPWSTTVSVITEEMPEISVIGYENNSTTGAEVVSCPAEYPKNTYLRADNMLRADEFIWQLTPINEGDPAMTPIGPSILITTPEEVLNLNNIANLDIGQSYRVGVKWSHGIVEQQSDYGSFCQIKILSPASTPPIPVMPTMGYITIDNSGTMSPIIPKPYQNQNSADKNFSTNNIYQLRIFDMMGREVHSKANFSYQEDQPFRINESINLTEGNYLIVLENSIERKTFKSHFY